MGLSAASAAAFYRDVVARGEVWTIRDTGGFATSTNGSGEKAMPFWSSRARAQAVIKSAPAYSGFEPFALGLDSFVDDWLAGLEKDGLLAGLNWSGGRVTGYDERPNEVAKHIARLRHLE